MTWGFCGVIILLIVSYLYLINSSVFNIMERREAEEKIGTLGTEVALLESKYIELSSDIDMDLAQQLGFREIDDTEAKFTAKISAPVSVSLVTVPANN